ncbi:polyprenol phosphomannose-dependent alpha 1,6 mannosyltransferase MptB [Nocardioides acrostichi]|uniref:Polyprenol phosphomannose-dependent alpha 1,6 mannosyltransferase MptB n=1 Tax=Nocardioides acrostichi TaxID=2784339 RepID=A0A930V255_9ACTN|nr:polyprenol phosphomannose-dependent alpha 1,6 mannosyltransferase MptB [Nocardioides acrostichi]MBF4162496.1 polyprenol phosphomannose-dependent alpha 1,6 mannosyltransferase MptB [Nocardioides acrostichi]
MSSTLVRGALGSVLVSVGGLVGSAMPSTARVLRLPLLIVLRDSETGRMAALAVVLLGLALLAQAWLRLLREVTSAATGDRTALVDRVRLAALAWTSPLLLAPPLFSRDGWSYAAQGMLQHWGISPYRHGPWLLDGPIVDAVDPRWLHTPTPYGPVPLALGGAISGITGNPWILVIGYRVLALVGLGLLAWAVPRLATWAGRDPAFASALVLASPFMVANGVAGLHNDLLMAGLMAAALVVGVERGWVWGAVLGGLAAAVKAPGGLVCVAIALVSLPVAASLVVRFRRLAAVAAVSLGTLFGLGVVAGTGSGWIGALSVPGTINTPLSLATLGGGTLDWIAGVLHLGLAPATMLGLVRGGATMLMFVVVGAMALRRPSGDRGAAVATAAGILGVLVLTSPVVHLWYLLWVLPFVACLRLSRAALSGLVAASVVGGLVAPMDSSLHGAYYAIVLGSVLIAVLAGLLLWTPLARGRVEQIARRVGQAEARETDDAPSCSASIEATAADQG